MLVGQDEATADSFPLIRRRINRMGGCTTVTWEHFVRIRVSCGADAIRLDRAFWLATSMRGDYTNKCY